MFGFMKLHSAASKKQSVASEAKQCGFEATMRGFTKPSSVVSWSQTCYSRLLKLLKLNMVAIKEKFQLKKATLMLKLNLSVIKEKFQL